MAFASHSYSPSDNSCDPAYVDTFYSYSHSPSYHPCGDQIPWSDVHPSPSNSTQSYTSLPLHAPAPLPGQSTPLLFSCGEVASDVKQIQLPFNYLQFPPPPLSDSVSGLPNPFLHQQDCATTRPTQPTFPTPSAMLVELANSAGLPPSLVAHPSDPKDDHSRKPRRRPSVDPALPDQSIPLHDPAFPLEPPHTAIHIPNDTISSHEKKRHYLECLEYYVTYLQQQIDLIGHVPVKLQRPAASTRGMSSQSIRTLLVHMEHLTKRLNIQMSAEEQHFVHLRQIAEQVQESQRQPAASYENQI
ncbi:hypothetical protein H0H92_002590 [Tricholoma furcatifolium]|nr:hypothetical protein H0H92_002590 [Tricholoma furcatifolium]